MPCSTARADIAVHSAKDLPSTPADGLTIGAFSARRDPFDALVGARLDQLDQGATVASGSVRRRAQLAQVRPDLRFVELRGNIDTRLSKIPDGGAIVMAVAALQILDLTDRIAQTLPLDDFVPAVGQGCVAVECRSDDVSDRRPRRPGRPRRDAPRGRGRAGVPRRARVGVFAAGRRARGRRAAAHVPGRPGTTACGRRPRDPRRNTGRPRRGNAGRSIRGRRTRVSHVREFARRQARARDPRATRRTRRAARSPRRDRRACAADRRARTRRRWRRPAA